MKMLTYDFRNIIHLRNVVKYFLFIFYFVIIITY
jgi:hypothetical protein